jgi:hypothetical protein
MNFRACCRLSAVLLLGAVAAAAPRSTQPDWHVDSLKATVTINPDSSLLVDETQMIPENDRYFGLRCDIPIGSEDRWDRTFNPDRTDDNGLRVKVEKVTVDGQPVAFRLDHYRHSFYQVIVDKNRTNSVEPGQHELNVVYRVTGVIRSVGANDELYWNVAGHKLSVRYDSMSVRVVLPAGVPAESVQASSYAGSTGSIETAKFPDGAEFSTNDVHSHESLSITMRWPQGYIHEGGFAGRYGPPYFLAPLLLLAIYFSARLYLRRNVERYSTAPQYEPPEGLSPAAMRYVVSGVIDGTSIAACLASLAVKGYIEVQARGTSFACWRTIKCDTDLQQLPAEEAVIADLLFDPNANVAGPARNPASKLRVKVVLNAESGDAAFQPNENEYVDLAALKADPSFSKQHTSTTTFGPSDPRINVLVGVTYARMKLQFEGKYSTWNAWIVLLGMLATLIFGLGVVLSTGQESNSLFLVVWSFFFFQGFTAVMSMALFSGKRKPLNYVAFSLGFAGATFLAARVLAQDITWVPVASYIAMILVNAAFVPLLRTATVEGQKLLAQIRGYKLFLQETELDRLKVLGQTPTAMPKLGSLPYAIALDLKEPWGDAMSNAFASAATTV